MKKVLIHSTKRTISQLLFQRQSSYFCVQCKCFMHVSHGVPGNIKKTCIQGSKFNKIDHFPASSMALLNETVHFPSLLPTPCSEKCSSLVGCHCLLPQSCIIGANVNKVLRDSQVSRNHTLNITVLLFNHALRA